MRKLDAIWEEEGWGWGQGQMEEGTDSESEGEEEEEEEAGEAGEEEEPDWPKAPDDIIMRPMEETATYIEFAKRYALFHPHLPFLPSYCQITDFSISPMSALRLPLGKRSERKAPARGTRIFSPTGATTTWSPALHSSRNSPNTCAHGRRRYA